MVYDYNDQQRVETEFALRSNGMAIFVSISRRQTATPAQMEVQAKCAGFTYLVLTTNLPYTASCRTFLCLLVREQRAHCSVTNINTGHFLTKSS